MVERPFFHHPDLSPPLLRRRAAELLVDLLVAYAEALATRGRSLVWHHCFPSRTAYFAAVHRLRKAGVIAYVRSSDQEPVLKLAPGAEADRKILFHPERSWKKKWSGIWSVLTYDVSERNRSFRDSLRRLLVRLRMGCLQKSVWISPRDIRPDYDDLVRAVGVDGVSYLFEATTVLGRDPQDLVLAAWDFDRLGSLHRWYLDECHRGLESLKRGPSRETVARMTEEEMRAYLSAMREDPLLPQALLPRGYQGLHVLEAHRRFVKRAGVMLRRPD